MMFLTKFGGDLLSHVLRRSTIGATALNCRVRDGIGCFARAMTTKLKKKHQNPRSNCIMQLFLILLEVELLLDQIKPIEQLVPVN